MARRARLRWLVFSLLPVAALLAALEVGAYVLEGQTALSPASPAGWTVRPGLEGYPVRPPAPQSAFTVTSNAAGLRSPYAVDRRPGARRLMAFGDSTVFGWGLAAEQAPPAALEAVLAAERGGAWEVVNAGQPGYSSEQARRLAEALLPAWQPDGIVWFHPWHDVSRGTEDRRALPAEPLQRFWRYSALLRALQRRTIQRAAPLRPHDPLFSLTPDRRGIDERVPRAHREDNLERLLFSARRVGAWVIVALLPNPRTLAAPRPDPLAEELRAFCDARDMIFVDLSREPAGTPIEDLTLPGDTGHFTAEANRLFAARIADRIPQQPTLRRDR